MELVIIIFLKAWGPHNSPRPTFGTATNLLGMVRYSLKQQIGRNFSRSLEKIECQHEILHSSD